MTITLQDVCWLREAALKRGSHQMPPAIARKLMGALLITKGTGDCMHITPRGEIALARLG